MKNKGQQPLVWSPGMLTQSGRPSPNLGDLIIERCVLLELAKIFGIDHRSIDRIATHERLTPPARRKIADSSHIIVGGSNLLSSYMDGYFQWDLIMSDALRVRRSILMGAGWWRDQGACNRYTKLLLWAALSWKGWHSVRDSQAKTHLAQIGFKRVLNTGCPTMWRLLDANLEEIRTKQCSRALLMLTDYHQDEEADKQIVHIMSEAYDEVFFWPQGIGDKAYAERLGFNGFFLDRTLGALDEFLDLYQEVDYLGTRLHGGIECLSKNKRCLTIAIDNRTREIASDTGLPSVPRGDIDAVRKWIDGSEPVTLRLPKSDIERWKSQFTH